MTAPTIEANDVVATSPSHSNATDSDAGNLRELQLLLLRAVTTNQSKEAAISVMAAAVAEATNPEVMVYLERHASQRWHVHQLPQGTRENLPAQLQERLFAWSDDACRNGTVQINVIDLPTGGIAVTAPILLKGRPPDAFAAVYRPATQPVDRLVVVHQLIAAHIALWQVLGQMKQAEFEAQTTASLMELLANLETAHDLRDASLRLVNELTSHLGCHRVALGLSTRGKDRCQLIALSGMDRFDKRSEIARVIEACLDEAVMRESLTVWPTEDDLQRQGGLAHEKLRATTAAGCVISCPLHDDEEQLVGAWLFLGEADFGMCESNLNFIDASRRPVASRLRLLRQAQRGKIARWVPAVLGQAGTSRRKLLLTALGVLAIGLCLPLRYNVKCPCAVEPVVRRAVVSPYDGMLQKVYVERGALVARHDVLARMDEREIQWELASLDAEYNRAKKERDASMADDEIAAAQRAKLEMQRLDLKRKLLLNRGANLEIKSPIDGIVISGDLQRVEGAPLTVGDSLFEIAPLDELVVELSVEDREINHVAVGADVQIRLEAYPWHKWKGTIANIWPRSEIRDDENVFVAEVRLNNADLQLRPGMKGRAKIQGQRHTLAWNLFHKPCESLLLWLGW